MVASKGAFVPMLTLLRKGMRRRAALVLGALYFLCSAVPGVALSFTDAKAAAHCVTDNHHGVKAHDHDEGAVHDERSAASSEQSSNEPSNHSGSCCGAFCVSEFPSAPVFVFNGSVRPSASKMLVEQRVVGDSPAGIDRPPKVLLSF